jgi:hypothetical protein
MYVILFTSTEVLINIRPNRDDTDQVVLNLTSDDQLWRGLPLAVAVGDVRSDHWMESNNASVTRVERLNSSTCWIFTIQLTSVSSF